MAEKMTPGRDTVLSLGVARFLSWASLLFILLSSLAISVTISNSAQKTILRKQQEFAQQFAENLNHQIYQRYTVPRYLGVRGITLFNIPIGEGNRNNLLLSANRLEPLDQIVQTTVHNLQVTSLKIYNYHTETIYSLSTTTESDKETASSIARVRATNKPEFKLESAIPFWKALFTIHLPQRSFIMRAIYPMSTENRLISYENEGSELDILEFSEDITEEYRAIIGFQWIIIATTMVSSAILFILLLLLIRKAEKMLRERLAEQQRLERELNQHEKLAGMGRVVSSIAHEIRNPLGIIRSSAELLLRRIPPGDVTYSLLSAIHDESKRLSQTVTDFLDYARPRTPSLTPVDLCVLIEQARVFLQSAFKERDVAFEIHCPGNMTVAGDKDLLYRAIYNIITNALQAMGSSGTLQVDVFKKDGHVILEFTDSGPGFDPAVKDRILDPFFTTKDDGTGLGLPIVQSIITSHNGALELENVPGGARVRVTLNALEN